MNPSDDSLRKGLRTMFVQYVQLREGNHDFKHKYLNEFLDEADKLVNTALAQKLEELLEQAKPMRGGKLGSVVTINQAVPVSVIKQMLKDIK